MTHEDYWINRKAFARGAWLRQLDFDGPDNIFKYLDWLEGWLRSNTEEKT